MTDLSEFAALIAVSGPAAGLTFRLQANASVGRDASNVVAIQDPSLSRHHCLIVSGPDGWTVRDEHSFNGTFVNGERITERRLDDSDRLRLGGTELLFRCRMQPSAPAGADAVRGTTCLRIDDSIYLRSTEVPAGSSRVQRDLHALVTMATVVNRLQTRTALERALVQSAADMVPGADAALVCLDETSAAVTVRRRDSDGGPARQLSQPALDLAVQRGEAVLWNPSTGDTPPAGAEPPSVLAVPLFEGERVTTLLHLTMIEPGGSFDRLHLELVSALAGIGTIALKNVGRIEALESQTAQLKEVLAITHQMVGQSAAMDRVYKVISKVAPTDVSVLISGETGTGKELAARAIHANSPRAAWPFVAINCATLAEALLESELFGHERGAFSGAVEMKRGQLELADRGTLFLDEIAELSPAVQAKLLRVLQQREFQRLGGTRPIHVDIRLIAASNRRLEEEVQKGRFREDLFFRLNVVRLDMPPLRKRRDDIQELVRHFLTRAREKQGRPVQGLSPSAERCLLAYNWPGNVRELENAIAHAVVMASAPEVVPEDLPDAITEFAQAQGACDRSWFNETVTNAKKQVVREALTLAGGQITEAARLLGLHPNYLHRLLRNLQLRADTPASRSPEHR
jgi:Nif-specific regulatory protein